MFRNWRRGLEAAFKARVALAALSGILKIASICCSRFLILYSDIFRECSSWRRRRKKAIREGTVMIMKNFFTGVCRGWMSAAVIIIMFGLVSLAHAAEHLLVWPLAEVSAGASARVSLEAHEIRKGQIALAPGIVPQVSGAAGQARIAVSGGDAVSITAFPDATYQATVDSVEYQSDGTMTINARLKDHKIQTVVLTIGPDGFLITLQDLNRHLLYRITGDSRSATGTVTEIDVTKMPQMIR